MILLAWFLLQAAGSVLLVDETYSIPGDNWRFLKLAEALEERTASDLVDKAALVVAQFEVTPPSQRARLALVRLEDLSRLQAGQPPEVITATAYLPRGNLQYHVPAAGDYVIVVDNRGQPNAQVKLHVRLEFPAVTRLTRERQLTVILISFAVFFGIVGWSARRLWRVMKG